MKPSLTWFENSQGGCKASTYSTEARCILHHHLHPPLDPDSVSTWSVIIFEEKSSAGPVYIINNFGKKQLFERSLFYGIVTVSWISQLLAMLFGACYYGSHPSSVSLNPKEKMNAWRNLSWVCSSKGEQ